MARTKSKERPTSRAADVEVGSTGGPTPPSKLAIALLGVCVSAALWAIMMMFPAGRVAYVYIFSYLEFYIGVLALVSLSITVMVGLVSTDRLVLTIRQRLLLQSAHRTTGVIAVGSLGLHLWTKFAESHIRLIDIFIPGLYPGDNKVYVAFGTISAYVMVFTMWTGFARARFIGRGKPWMWRAMHAISYLMWPIALFHGLLAGRAVSGVWVNWSYAFCVLGVIIGLSVRIAVSLNRKKDFASRQGTAGSASEAAATSTRLGRGRGRGDDAVVSDRGNAIQAWKPAARPEKPVEKKKEEEKPAAVTAANQEAPVVSERPRREDTASRRRSEFVDAPTQRWEAGEEDDEPIRRPRRRTDDEPSTTSTRMRRPRRDDDDRYDEPTGSHSRRALTGEMPRYVDEEPDPAPRQRRRVSDDEPSTTSTRMRRYEDEDEMPAPRPRRRVSDDEPSTTSTRMRRYEDEDEMPAPRPRRRVSDDEPSTTSTRMRRYEDEDDMPPARPRRRPAEERYEDEMPPARPRASRYADEDDDVPRSRRGDRADSGRHSRSEFVDLADLEPDDSPTLVDMAQRRARRSGQQEPARSSAGRGARRGGRGDEEDAQYWAQLRGEAQ